MMGPMPKAPSAPSSGDPARRSAGARLQGPELGLQGLDQQQVRRHLLLCRPPSAAAWPPIGDPSGSAAGCAGRTSPRGRARRAAAVPTASGRRPGSCGAWSWPAAGGDLLGWDPGLGQVLHDQEQDEPAGVQLVGLGLLGPTSLGFGRVGEVHPDAASPPTAGSRRPLHRWGRLETGGKPTVSGISASVGNTWDMRR